MDDLGALRRLATASVALAIVIAVPASLAFYGAFGWDLAAGTFGEPSAILGRGPEAAALLRWGAIGDMFFSYLLLVPLVLFLHRRLRPIKPWLADVGTVGGLAYIFVGGAGAAILATVGPPLVEAYATADAAGREQIQTAFDMLRNIVFFGLWQLIDPITAGAWVASTGWLLLVERPIVGRLLVPLGVGVVSMSTMSMFNFHSIALLGAGLVVVLVVWVGWVAVDRRASFS